MEFHQVASYWDRYCDAYHRSRKPCPTRVERHTWDRHRTHSRMLRGMCNLDVDADRCVRPCGLAMRASISCQSECRSAGKFMSLVWTRTENIFVMSCPHYKWSPVTGRVNDNVIKITLPAGYSVGYVHAHSLYLTCRVLYIFHASHMHACAHSDVQTCTHTPTHSRL